MVAMVQVSYPGVYVQEVASGSRTITGVSTSIAMFIGRTDRGPMNKPTRLFSPSEFARTFGTGVSKGELPTAVRLFFANGGTQAYVMRIASGAAKAAVTLENLAETPVLRVEAREEGELGGLLRVAIDYNTNNFGTTFNASIRRVDSQTLVETELELHTELSMLSTSTRFVEDVLAQNSKLVTASVVAPDSGTKGYVVGARILNEPDGPADDALTALLGSGDWTLRYQYDDEDPQNLVLPHDAYVAGTLTTDIVLSYLSDLGNDSFLVKLTLDNASLKKSLRILPSGAPNDIATVLQFGPIRGGIEQLYNADLRPAPTGIVLAFSNYARLPDLAILTQVTAVDIDIDGTLIPLVAGPDDTYSDGSMSPVQSLANVRENLERLASQFNTAAVNTANFPWKLEAQGYYLVLRPTAGPANTGFDADVTTALTSGKYTKKSNVRYYSLGTGTLGLQGDPALGADGGNPTLGDYTAAFDIIRRDVDIFNILVLPRSTGISEAARQTHWGPASVFCQERRAFLLIDPPADWKTVADVTGGAITIGNLRAGVVKDHAAVYFPRLTVIESGINKPVDPSGAVAGIYARTDGSRGVWKAPAGMEADVRAITGVERNISDPENGVTNPLAIDTIRAFANGIVVWGARTMDGFDNSGNDDYKYVPIRRLALFIAESLARGLKFAVFEPNDEPLWAQLRLAAGGFMNNLFRQGAFQGQKKSDAYFVKVDNETTTQNDINLGIVNVVIGFAPLKPAEFVVVTIQQIAGQVQI
jgi:phage tail sheath protein FI